jgi:hypothetical protein
VKSVDSFIDSLLVSKAAFCTGYRYVFAVIVVRSTMPTGLITKGASENL